MLTDLDGARVVVTGASSGIGAALAEGLAARGAILGICARREDRLAEVLDRCRSHTPESRMWVQDLSELDGLSAFAQRMVSDLGGVDVLINNAGIPKRRWAWDLDGETVDRIMAINYSSPVRLTLALLPELRARSGSIVFVGSVAARLAPPAEAAYAASKAALSAFAEGLRVDLGVAGEDVGVHLVQPGVIRTDLFDTPDDEASLADISPLEPSDMVQPVVELLASGNAERYVPSWFADLPAVKAGDLTGFLAGSAEYARERLTALGLPIP